MLIWHIDSKAELILYSVTSVGADIITDTLAVFGIIQGIAAAPETLGASLIVAVSAYEVLTMAGVDFAYDIASVTHYSVQFEAQGSVDVSIASYVIPGIIVDLFENQRKGDMNNE